MIFITQQELTQLSKNAPKEVTFQDKIYIHGADFSSEMIDAAVEFCQLYVDRLSLLLVDCQSYLSVWIEKEKFIPDVQSTKNQLDPDFIFLCEQKLSEFIGPIASLVCQYTFNQNPKINKTELIQSLAEHIDDPQAAKAFCHQSISYSFSNV
jgi:hypothetical protein